ncbi:hypothetical protein L1887_57793 [Cichorium endivia]|nr:hypothetical protein L1887_57793 [Cichorium endivia]
MIGRADIEGSKSNVAMNAWLPQASYPCDVPPQPNSPPDNVFRPDRPARQALGPKEGHCPASDSRNNRIPLVRTSSELAVRRPGKAPKEPFPVRPPAGTRRPALAAEAARAVRRQPTGSGLGPPCPALRANPFPEVTDPFCRLPLPTLFPSTRGCSPWRPDAVMSTTGRGRHSEKITLPEAPADVSGLPNVADRLTHVQVPFTWNLSPLRPSKFSFEYLLLPPRSAPTAAPPRLTPKVLQRPPRPPTHRGPGTCPDGRVLARSWHRNPASGSSRIASSAYQKWPTWSSRFRGTAQRSSRAVLPI